jgi:hypothetical protein
MIIGSIESPIADLQNNSTQGERQMGAVILSE